MFILIIIEKLTNSILKQIKFIEKMKITLKIFKYLINKSLEEY